MLQVLPCYLSTCISTGVITLVPLPLYGKSEQSLRPKLVDWILLNWVTDVHEIEKDKIKYARP